MRKDGDAIEYIDASRLDWKGGHEAVDLVEPRQVVYAPCHVIRINVEADEPLAAMHEISCDPAAADTPVDDPPGFFDGQVKISLQNKFETHRSGETIGKVPRYAGITLRSL